MRVDKTPSPPPARPRCTRTAAPALPHSSGRRVHGRRAAGGRAGRPGLCTRKWRGAGSAQLRALPVRRQRPPGGQAGRGPPSTVTRSRGGPGGTCPPCPPRWVTPASCHHVPPRAQWQLGGQAVTVEVAASSGLCRRLLRGQVGTGPCPLPSPCPSGGPESPARVTASGLQAPSRSRPRGRGGRTWAGRGAPPRRPPCPRRPRARPRAPAGAGSRGPGPSSAWRGSTGRGHVQPRQQPRATAQHPQPVWGCRCPSGPPSEQVLGLSAQADAPPDGRCGAGHRAGGLWAPGPVAPSGCWRP